MKQSTARWTSWVALMAVGMLLTAAGSTSAQTDVTFTRDVAPILQRSCQGCHRTGQMAPMSLMTYAEVRPLGPGDPQQGEPAGDTTLASGQDGRDPGVPERHFSQRRPDRHDRALGGCGGAAWQPCRSAAGARLAR